MRKSLQFAAVAMLASAASAQAQIVNTGAGVGPTDASWSVTLRQKSNNALLYSGPAQFIPIGFYSAMLWFSVAVYQLVFTIIAAIVGAAPYSEKGASAH